MNKILLSKKFLSPKKILFCHQIHKEKKKMRSNNNLKIKIKNKLNKIKKYQIIKKIINFFLSLEFTKYRYKTLILLLFKFNYP
jgi:hypothetical protein